MAWLEIALALLKFANFILDRIRTQGDIDAGRDAEIARTSASILTKTQAAKNIMAQVTGMTGEQVDAALKSLEP